MIVWVNGPFGVGKTTTCRAVADLLPQARTFDPEWVGYMLASNLRDIEVADFQDHPSWRRLVPVVADEVMAATGHHLVVAQSVLVERYWRELGQGLAALGREVFHVLLDADATTLRARIDADTAESVDVRPWRHDHVEPYLEARPWMRAAADLVVDTASRDAADTAEAVATTVSPRLRG